MFFFFKLKKRDGVCVGGRRTHILPEAIDRLRQMKQRDKSAANGGSKGDREQLWAA